MISFGTQLCFGIGSRSETARNAGWTFMRSVLLVLRLGIPLSIAAVNRIKPRDVL